MTIVLAIWAVYVACFLAGAAALLHWWRFVRDEALMAAAEARIAADATLTVSGSSGAGADRYDLTKYPDTSFDRAACDDDMNDADLLDHIEAEAVATVVTIEPMMLARLVVLVGHEGTVVHRAMLGDRHELVKVPGPALLDLVREARAYCPF